MGSSGRNSPVHDHDGRVASRQEDEKPLDCTGDVVLGKHADEEMGAACRQSVRPLGDKHDPSGGYWQVCLGEGQHAVAADDPKEPIT